MKPEEIESIKAVLNEAYKRDSEVSQAGDIAKAEHNSMVKRYMKEMTLSDAITTLAAMYGQVLQATNKMAVAREIINVVPVATPSTRFYRRKKGAVWRIAQGPPTQSTGRYDYVDINLDHEYGEDALFTQNYIEDCPFPLIQAEVSEAGQLLEEQLTNDVIALYDAMTAANLAGGAEIDVATNGTFAYTDIVKGWKTQKVAGYDRMPGRKVLLIGPNAMEDLLNDDKFLNSHYPASSMMDINRGILGSIFGYTIVESDLMTADGANDKFAYLMNIDQAAAVTMRRDRLVQPYAEKLSEGVIITNRYGLGALREAAVVRYDIVA